MPAAIEIEGLSKTYRRRRGDPVQAVNDLHLAVPPGQVFGFLGPNGAGKTTTIKMICGLVTPNAGRIRLNGFDLAHQHGAAMLQIGTVLEGTRNIYWRLTPLQNLLYFGRLKGRSGPALRARAEQLLRELDLWDRRGDPIRQFSRGMQQKVAIACALIADPPIVLLDEPTLGLDVQAARTVRQWVERLAREQGKTVVLTSHQLDMVQQVCDRVAIIHHGNLIADEQVDSLINVFSEEHYQIKIAGGVPADAPWLGELAAEAENGHTVLTGPIPDQAALHGILEQVYALDLPLISVNRVEPDLEEVFVRLTDQAPQEVA